jgi:site-specific recombinase XerC
MNIDGFLTKLKTQTSSAETLRAYKQDLEKFEEFIRMNSLRVTQVKPSTVNEYIEHLAGQRRRALAPATVARRLAVLSSFFDFLSANTDGKISNPVKNVKRPRGDNDQARALEDSVLARLIDGITDARDKAMILVLLYSGLRLSELRQLNKDTIVPQKRKAPDGTIQYFGVGEVVGKGRKRRKFIIGPTALEALGTYIRTCRTKDNHPALFLSAHHKRISGRSIQHVLDRWCRRGPRPYA